MYVPSLQMAVDRYEKSLAVPSMLEKLHPRKQQNPGNARALPPAIILTSISAFEGFVEDFLATLGAQRNQSFAQIAKLADSSNPTVKVFEEKLGKLLSWGDGKAWKSTFRVNVWKRPATGRTYGKRRQPLDWPEVLNHADGWMQVRHCLAHGLASGIRREHWPDPIKGPANAITASSVLVPQSHDQHSLYLKGAESCANIYLTCAIRLADEAATFVGHPPLKWSRVSEFKI